MKKLFFIIPLLSGVITAIGCSNNSHQDITQEASNTTIIVEEQTKIIFKDVDVYVFAELVEKKQGQMQSMRSSDM